MLQTSSNQNLILQHFAIIKGKNLPLPINHWQEPQRKRQGYQAE